MVHYCSYNFSKNLIWFGVASFHFFLLGGFFQLHLLLWDTGVYKLRAPSKTKVPQIREVLLYISSCNPLPHTQAPKYASDIAMHLYSVSIPIQLQTISSYDSVILGWNNYNNRNFFLLTANIFNYNLTRRFDFLPNIYLRGLRQEVETWG